MAMVFWRVVSAMFPACSKAALACAMFAAASWCLAEPGSIDWGDEPGVLACWQVSGAVAGAVRAEGVGPRWSIRDSRGRRFSLFEQVWLEDLNDRIGLIANRDNEPDFSAVAARLSDGVNDLIELVMDMGGISAGASSFEADAWRDRPFLDRPDLFGSRIDALTLDIERLWVRTPGDNPNGDGNWSQVDFDVTVRLIGLPMAPIPLPPGAFAAAPLLAILAWRGLLGPGSTAPRWKRRGGCVVWRTP